VRRERRDGKIASKTQKGGAKRGDDEKETGKEHQKKRESILWKGRSPNEGRADKEEVKTSLAWLEKREDARRGGRPLSKPRRKRIITGNAVEGDRQKGAECIPKRERDVVTF